MIIMIMDNDAYYLNSDYYINIHVLNRAQIINDLFVFVRDRQINGTILYNLLKFLKRDTDYVTWYPMFEIFKWWKNAFSLPESRYIKVNNNSFHKNEKCLYKMCEKL